MCYLVAKHCAIYGCILMKVEYSKHFEELKRELRSLINNEKISVRTVSSPDTYAEYRPYISASSEEEFRALVMKLNELEV